MAILALVEGAGVAGGLLLIMYGLTRRTAPVRPARPAVSWSREQTTRLAAALVVAAGVGLLTHWPVGVVLAGLAVWTLPRMLGADRQQERAMASTEAIASWAEMLRDNLGAAAGLEQAIIAAADVPPAAIAQEVTALAVDIRAGARLTDALARFREEMADPTADLVVRALQQAARRQASRLADLLTELAEVARRKVSVRLRVAAGRARVRTSARVVAATTVVMAIGLALLNHRYLAAYDTLGGQVALLLVGALFATGFLGLARLGKVGDSPVPVTSGGVVAAETASGVRP